MKRLLTFGLFILFSLKLFGQINPADSTHQVIAYWDKNEKQTYLVSLEKYKIRGGDTTGRSRTTYEVEVTVTDSTEKSYTVEWLYKNYSVESENEFDKKTVAAAQNRKVLFKTTEMGTFEELLNWKEVNQNVYNSTEQLKNENRNVPKIDEMIAQVRKNYSTKEAIEEVGIPDVQQFYNFHGAQYKLHEELKGNIPVANLLGGKPFDADITIVLDEIDFEDNSSVLRLRQAVDSKTLTDATYEYLKTLYKKSGPKLPKRKDFPALQNLTRVSSIVHGPSGWLIYSVETKEVWSGDMVNIEERIIDLK